MVKRCAWGRYNTYTWYHERIGNGVYFIPFPKLKQGRAKCPVVTTSGQPFGTLAASGGQRTIMDLFVSTCAFVVFVCPHLFPIVICVLTCSPLCALTCLAFL